MASRYEVPTSVRSEAESLIGESLAEVEFGIRSTPEKRLRRAAQMTVLYHDHDWALERIGIAYGMSRERVRQVLTSHGIERRPMQGHASYRATIAKKRAMRKQNEAAV